MTSKSLVLVSALATLFTLATAERAEAQVVVQGEGTVYGGGQGGGQVYGQGSVYVQGGTTSPYVAGGGGGAPQPTRVVVHTQPTMGLVIAGVIAFGAGWLLHGLVATSLWQDCTGGFLSCPEDAWMGTSWIPLAGPWIAGFGTNYGNEVNFVFNMLMGVVQAVGAVLLVLGLAIQQEWEEPVYALGEGDDAPQLSFQLGAGNVGATLAF